MFANSGRFLRQTLRSRGLRRLSLAITVLLLVSLFSPFLQPSSLPTALAAPAKKPYPTNLSKLQVHPGSALVAFRSVMQFNGTQVVSTGAGASSDDIKAVNGLFSALRVSQVTHLFTNLPAAELNAARAKAQAATGQYVTDFTQVYELKFDPAINSGEAVNRLNEVKLVSSAMPDWIFQQPSHGEVRDATQTTPAGTNSANAAISAGSLPPNYSFITDGQSYHDAASNNVTGAISMLKEKFGKQPGEGEIITNISLGNVNDKSTVLENGQRYLEQRGFPKIPVWLASGSSTCNTSGPGPSCSITLDPTATTKDNQGDLLEVLLDFSVMAPPPRGDARVPNPQVPGQLGEILGAAYGAKFRLINPLTNGTANFFAAWFAGGILQSPRPTVMTASIGDGFGLGFSDYFFEQETLIHDVVTLLVNGYDIFVTISAGDGQSETEPAMNPNGITGPTEVTKNPNKIVDINDPANWANPKYSYGVTFEPQYLIDSGGNSAGGNTLNDIFNNNPYNRLIEPNISHSQHTTETRWTGQQNFHSGNGSRTNIAAPADDVLFLAQVEVGGQPVNPVDVFPRLVGGTSASCPEIAAAAAIVRQTSKLLGHPMSARQVRDFLAATGRENIAPTFDLDKSYVGQVLDLTRAIQTLFEKYQVKGNPQFVRMTVAQRKAVPYVGAYGRSFFTDTKQDPIAKTAEINLAQGLVPPSSRTNETVGNSGDNIFAPITFAVDAAYVPTTAVYQWRLSYGDNIIQDVPNDYYDQNQPYLRMLPAEIFDTLGLPLTSTTDRVVKVTALADSAEISYNVTFKGQIDTSYTHAIPPAFEPILNPVLGNPDVTIHYDLRGLRDGSGGLVDGGVLIISDIDRAVPQAFPDLDPDAHGIKKKLNGLVGDITFSSSELVHGVGTYGVAIRGSKGGKELGGRGFDPTKDTTSAWIPLRYAPENEIHPATPKVQAEASLLNGTAPLFYDVADIEPGGSSRFSISYDVSNIDGALAALVEFSAPTYDFAKGIFITGNFDSPNKFTNPYGDRLDTGNNFGQAGGSFHKIVSGAKGKVTFDGATIGLSIPVTNCDKTVQIRVFAVDSDGKVLGVASNPSLFSYADFSRAVCFR